MGNCWFHAHGGVSFPVRLKLTRMIRPERPPVNGKLHIFNKAERKSGALSAEAGENQISARDTGKKRRGGLCRPPGKKWM
jgi:hypothetical protein